MTKKEVLTMVIDVMKNEDAQFTAEQKEEVIAYATSALEAMAKKAEKAKTYKTPAQKDAEALKPIVAEALTAFLPDGATVSELIKSSDALKDYSTQKIAAILRKLIADGCVVKNVDKKVTHYILIKEGGAE